MHIIFIRLVVIITCIIGATSATAYQGGSVHQQAQLYDFKMCVAARANHCINQVCLTSNQRDCQSQCHDLAKSSCLDER